MPYVDVDYHGIHPIGPEAFPCILLRWVEKNRFLPVWITSNDATDIDSRDSGFAPRRPTSIDLLIESLNRFAEGISAVRIVSYHEGVFHASIVLGNGEELDARVSDAVSIARILDIPIAVDSEILAHNAIFVSDDDLLQYAGIRAQFEEETLELAEPSASGDAEADADFEELMKSLGVSESDLMGDVTDESSDKDDEEGDRGKETL